MQCQWLKINQTKWQISYSLIFWLLKMNVDFGRDNSNDLLILLYIIYKNIFFWVRKSIIVNNCHFLKNINIVDLWKKKKEKKEKWIILLFWF